MLCEGMAMMADQERPVNLYRDTPFLREQESMKLLSLEVLSWTGSGARG